MVTTSTRPRSQEPTLQDMERAVAGTADNRWRIPRMNGRWIVDEARHTARI